MRVYAKTPMDLWREALAAGKAVAAAEFVHKAFASRIETKQVDTARRQVRFTITTDSPDRMKDVIHADGWRLESYKKNPVVLWAHQYGAGGLLGTGGVGLPVARSVDIAAKPKALTSLAEFATREQYPFADTVYQLVLGGFLNATSVGFRPLKHVFNEERGGVDFMEHELLEYSVVPIPANAEALVEARAHGIDTAPLREWAEGLLDSVYEEEGVWVPKRQLEVMLAKGLPTGRRISIPPAPKDNHPVPGGYPGLEEFLDNTTPITEAEAAGLTEVVVGADMAPPAEKPYPSEHACRIADPGGFTKFRRGTRDSSGKSYGVIYAKPKGEGGWQEQSYRYPKESWTAGEARTHCKGHDGSFEAAASAKDVAVAQAQKLLVEGKLGEAAKLLLDAEVGESKDLVLDVRDGDGLGPLYVDLLDDLYLELADDPATLDVEADTLARLVDARIVLMGADLRDALVAHVTTTLNKLRGRAD